MDDKQRIALAETRTQGNGGLPAQVIRYQLGNHLGSASVELDNSGALISYEEYHPYGTTAFQAGRSAAEVSLKRYRYTGKERDEETGFSYHGARYYVPWLGRWSKTDPVGLADGLNLYNYVRGNPINATDPSGRATQQQFQEVISTALGKIGNKTATGTAAEAVLEGMLKKAGHIIIKGPVTNKGAYYADLVTYDPESKQLMFFDNKFQGTKGSVTKVKAFEELRRAGVIQDALNKFKGMQTSLPAGQAKEIAKAFEKLASDPNSANFIVSNASPRALTNLAKNLSAKLTDAGIKFADASKGSKELQKSLNAIVESKTTAKALEVASDSGKRLAKALPAVGNLVSAGLAVPRIAEARNEDLQYEAMMRSMGAEPQLKGLSTLREASVIAGEEAGGEAGVWGGAAAGGLLFSATGPGAVAGVIGGGILFGVAGDWAGGKAAGFLFDQSADALYNSKFK
jgi:RHS repeat-associated protein